MISSTEFAKGCEILVRSEGFQKHREVEGCIVADGPGRRKHIRQRLAEGMNPQDIERFFNHQHVADLFSNFSREEVPVKLMKVVAQVWAALARAHLAEVFPEKRFCFEVTKGEWLSRDADDLIATFCQAGPAGQ